MKSKSQAIAETVIIDINREILKLALILLDQKDDNMKTFEQMLKEVTAEPPYHVDSAEDYVDCVEIIYSHNGNVNQEIFADGNRAQEWIDNHPEYTIEEIL